MARLLLVKVILLDFFPQFSVLSQGNLFDVGERVRSFAAFAVTEALKIESFFPSGLPVFDPGAPVSAAFTRPEVLSLAAAMYAVPQLAPGQSGDSSSCLLMLCRFLCAFRDKDGLPRRSLTLLHNDATPHKVARSPAVRFPSLRCSKHVKAVILCPIVQCRWRN